LTTSSNALNPEFIDAEKLKRQSCTKIWILERFRVELGEWEPKLKKRKARISSFSLAYSYFRIISQFFSHFTIFFRKFTISQFTENENLISDKNFTDCETYQSNFKILELCKLLIQLLMQWINVECSVQSEAETLNLCEKRISAVAYLSSISLTICIFLW
jgi:hypothetical protein